MLSLIFMYNNYPTLLSLQQLQSSVILQEQFKLNFFDTKVKFKDLRGKILVEISSFIIFLSNTSIISVIFPHCYLYYSQVNDDVRSSLPLVLLFYFINLIRNIVIYLV